MTLVGPSSSSSSKSSSSEDRRTSSASYERNAAGEKTKDGKPIYCICRSTRSTGFMIGCENCSEWFHGECIKITEEFAKNIHQYNCDLCVSRIDGVLEKIVFKKRYLKELERKKSEAAKVTTSKCGNCIGCFREVDCQKCEGCKSSPPVCVTRKCVQMQADVTKPPRASAGGAERVLPSRPRRDRVKSAEDSDAPASPVAPLPHPPVSAAVEKSPEKGKRGRKKGWRKDQQAQQPKVEDEDTDKDTKPEPAVEREVARAVYASYSNRRTRNVKKGKATEQPTIKHCLGPECTRKSREGSKYCSDECGRKLAKARLCAILPGRVKDFWSMVPRAEVRATEQLRELDALADSLHSKVNQLLAYAEMVTRYVQAIQGVEPMAADDTSEVDTIGNCTVCGLEFSSRQLPKHIERCFVRTEKQLTFGSNTKTPMNPHELFCETFNKATNTYCKRLRVMCAEHYKGELEANMKVCGCPKVWLNGRPRVFREIFVTADGLMNDGFCNSPRKDCLVHHRWLQTVLGVVEGERMNVLTRLGEVNERRHFIVAANQTRGNVITLLNCGRVAPDSIPPSREVKEEPMAH